jgi:hypothetical protein
MRLSVTVWAPLLAKAADPGLLSGKLMAAVGPEIGSYLSPMDILTSVAGHSDVSILIDALQVKGGFTTMQATLEDFLEYNQPELALIIEYFSDDPSRMGMLPQEQGDRLITVLTAYSDGLDLAIWKYLPAGMRLRYHEYFRDIPGYRVVPVTSRDPTLLAELPDESAVSAFSRLLTHVDSTLVGFRYSMQALQDYYTLRWVDLSRGKAAESQLIESRRFRIRVHPARRLVWVIREAQLLLWRADSLEPVTVASEIVSANHKLSPDGSQLLFHILLASGSQIIVAYPTDFSRPLVQEPAIENPARINPFQSGKRKWISCYPSRRSRDDLNVSSEGGAGLRWRVVDDARNNILAAFRIFAILGSTIGSHERQVLLGRIFSALNTGYVFGAWYLIEQFIMGRPYETASLVSLIRETISGNPLALEEVPGRIDLTAGRLVLPHLVSL